MKRPPNPDRTMIYILLTVLVLCLLAIIFGNPK